MTDDVSQPLETPDVPPTVASVPATTADAAPPAGDGAVTAAHRGDDDLELLGLIDRLAALLDRSDLTELEVEAGGTGLVLRKPSAIAPVAGSAPAIAVTAAEPAPASSGESATVRGDPTVAAKPSIKAPLTGIFYA